MCVREREREREREKERKRVSDCPHQLLHFSSLSLSSFLPINRKGCLITPQHACGTMESSLLQTPAKSSHSPSQPLTMHQSLRLSLVYSECERGKKLGM